MRRKSSAIFKVLSPGNKLIRIVVTRGTHSGIIKSGNFSSRFHTTLLIKSESARRKFATRLIFIFLFLGVIIAAGAEISSV
jgi:hypothetical protein